MSMLLGHQRHQVSPWRPNPLQGPGAPGPEAGGSLCVRGSAKMERAHAGGRLEGAWLLILPLACGDDFCSFWKLSGWG